MVKDVAWEINRPGLVASHATYNNAARQLPCSGAKTDLNEPTRSPEG
jgi:hypothetical protein